MPHQPLSMQPYWLAYRATLLDLDCLGIFAIVSVGSLVVTVFFHGSELLRESPARPVFQYWGLLMVVGTVCSVVAMLRDYPSEERCISLPSDATNTTEPVLLTSKAQLDLMQFNCTYACFNARQAFRDPSDIRVVPAGINSEIQIIGSLNLPLNLPWSGGLTLPSPRDASLLHKGRVGTHTPLSKQHP
jgi:hypothetical protein